MLGLFIANPGRAANPRRGQKGRKTGARSKGMKKYGNPWPRQKKAHATASRLGWAHRKNRKKKPARPSAYLKAAGLTRGALKKYRGARKTSPKALLAKRKASARKTGRRAALVNPRRAGTYAKFVKSFHRKTGLSGPNLMKAAGKAWRRNPGVSPGSVYFNQLPTVRPLMNRSKGRKKSRKGARKNPVLPYAAFNRGRKQARRNPVLPYFAFENQPMAAAARSADPFAAVKGAIETTMKPKFWMRTVLPMGAGFVGGSFLGGLTYAGAQQLVGQAEGVGGSVQRVASRTLGAAGAGAVALLATKDADLSSKVLAGGLIAVVVQVIQEVFGIDTYEKITGMADFVGGVAQDLTEELKERIARSVRGEIEAAEGTAGFATTQDLQVAPQLGPGPRMGDVGSFVSTEALQTAPVAEKGGAPMVADLSAFSDSSLDMALV